MQRRLGIGKRTEPVVRRHLAAPYIFLRLPRFPYPGGKETTNFPFLVALRFHTEGFHSYPNRHCCFLVRKSRRKETIVYDLTYFPLFHHVYFECLSILQWCYLGNEFTIFLRRFLTFDYETDAWQTILLSVNNHQRRRESKKGTSNKRGGGEPNTGE